MVALETFDLAARARRASAARRRSISASVSRARRRPARACRARRDSDRAGPGCGASGLIGPAAVSRRAPASIRAASTRRLGNQARHASMAHPGRQHPANAPSRRFLSLAHRRAAARATGVGGMRARQPEAIEQRARAARRSAGRARRPATESARGDAHARSPPPRRGAAAVAAGRLDRVPERVAEVERGAAAALALALVARARRAPWRATERAHRAARAPRGRRAPARRRRARRQRNSAASTAMPVFTTSASPARRWRAGSVAQQSRGRPAPPAGWWNAPDQVLARARGRSPVLPPTLLSTWASSVVGTPTQATPRSQVAAAKPARSPTTPPPSATTASSRSEPERGERVPQRASAAGRLRARRAGTATSVAPRCRPAAASGQRAPAVERGRRARR